MSIAIIAEYNPFHNGHIYQLMKTKELFPNEKIIIILSGKYTQRGEIAVASFKKRKKIALKYGADKVIQLPFKYATQAAHIFAKGAVEIINKNKIDKLIFGSETDEIEIFYQIAKSIYNDENGYYQKVKMKMKNGISFPKASAIVLEELNGISFQMPNDILGLEYVKEIVKNDYPIKAYCIKRTINFHSEEINDNFASASLIRKMLDQKQDISLYSPMRIKKVKKIEDYYPKFQKIVQNTPSEKLAKIKLLSEGMENLFKKNIDAKTYEEFVNRTNSKRYTSSRIKRAMLYVLLKKY
ncbi:MAG: nucleotidyltransferase [Metamycoplasmataceae bacterium]